MLARLTRWANSTTNTLACSRGVQLSIGPHFMYWILSMFKVQLASPIVKPIEDAWENVQAHSGRRENTLLARLTRWANSNSTTQACSRGIQLNRRDPLRATGIIAPCSAWPAGNSRDTGCLEFSRSANRIRPTMRTVFVMRSHLWTLAI
jgi:hypothetical protein